MKVGHYELKEGDEIPRLVATGFESILLAEFDSAFQLLHLWTAKHDD